MVLHVRKVLKVLHFQHFLHPGAFGYLSVTGKYV